MRKIIGTLFGLGLLFGLLGPVVPASLLPPAQVQFSDANGSPLAGGSVKFCIPNTGCGQLKATYRDAAAQVVNPNPVVLDSAGRATLYGVGAYDMQVRDSLGNLIFAGSTQEMNGPLATAAAANSLLGNPTNVAGPIANVKVNSPLGFANGNLIFGLQVVNDLTNQTVDQSYAFQTRAVLATVPLSYQLPTASNTYNGFSFTVAAVSQPATVSPTPADKIGASAAGTALTVPVGYSASFTTDAANPGTWYVQLTRQTSARNPGELVQYRANTCPAGTLLEDGSAISRTTYAGLFAVIGTTYGTGDGTLTFNLPDSRGLFNRGWGTGQTVDAGRTFGSTQQDALQSHTHTYTLSDNRSQATTGSGGANVNAGVTPGQSTGGAQGARTAAETRPVNIATSFCIATGLP